MKSGVGATDHRRHRRGAGTGTGWRADDELVYVALAQRVDVGAHGLAQHQVVKVKS